MRLFETKRRIKAAAVTIAVACTCALTLTFLPHVSATTAGPSVYFGVSAPGSLSKDLQPIGDFETQAGKNVSIINTFYNWYSGTTPIAFPLTTLENIHQHGSIPMLTWQPGNSGSTPVQPDFQLRDIINGNYDNFITNWATAAKASNTPIFLRFMHEMNGTWYPWAQTVNDNQPGDYVAAWRHVHDIFTQLGVTNVTWVWCVNTEYAGSSSIATAYPGDNYVDWVSFDAYDRGTVNGNTNRTFDQMVKPLYAKLVAIAPGKPIMVAEDGTVEQGNNKAAWFTAALTHDLPVSYPRIKAYVYFNYDKVYDERINSSAASQTAFAAGIGSSYYASNDFANLPASKIQPLANDAITSNRQAPFVSIEYPNFSSVITGSRIDIQVTASDKVGISSIDVSVDGKLVCTEHLVPYECYWTAPSAPGTAVTITATAHDRANNSAVSTVNITIQGTHNSVRPILG